MGLETLKKEIQILLQLRKIRNMNLPIKGALGNWVVALVAAAAAGGDVYFKTHDVASAIQVALAAFLPAFYHNSKGEVPPAQ